MLGEDGAIPTDLTGCFLNTLANTGLNDIIACTGLIFDATIVDVHAAFDGKALKLTHVGEGMGDIHPNDKGHKKIADALKKALKGS
ncbi:MAG: SGNH/GDSL hydrolase family protein [Proteobacteria bacterium]|nr:SGNH/GDSL hydrolase family protein [Pseudomonadota bacterium]